MTARELLKMANEYAEGFGKNDDATSFIAGFNAAMDLYRKEQIQKIILPVILTKDKKGK